MTEYSAPFQAGVVAFAAKIPGQITELAVQPGRGYLIHKHGFVCATEGVQLATGFQQSLGAGIFGGNGFLLQRLAGSCRRGWSWAAKWLSTIWRPARYCGCIPGMWACSRRA
ncbi:MAG: AIM24 family protein [Rhodospirillales bacterium]